MFAVHFIRHAESAANTGGATSAPISIPLTPRGHDQSREVSNSFGAAPDLIVRSPLLSIQQTATPTCARFTAAPVET
jgi:probable phosphoglycerate mutase